jgi:hypothetical protein
MRGGELSLIVVGKIMIKDISCQHCGNFISMWARSDFIKCNMCGASYEVKKSTLKDQHVEYEFDFVGFQCIYNNVGSTCKNTCPSQGMYCEDHVSDKSFEKASSSISYFKKQVENAEERLEIMKESKKTWLILKLSGMEEDNEGIVSEDEE